ncbi:MFS transporter [Nonomuraea muscovyensis]|uniref:MFS transporter n=1 Tax=Nonomuraea muscovyensis TaxID=1124761 RepID=UPI003408F254
MRDDRAGTAVREPTARAPERERCGWAPVAALAMGTFAIGTDMFVVAGILGDIAADLGVTTGAAGVVVTVFALAYAIGTVLLGALLGSWPPRRVLVGSAALFGLLAVLSAAAPALPALLAARVLGALAASVYVPAAGAAAVAAVPAGGRGRALGVVLAGTSAAMVAGAPLGMLLASALSWRAAFGLVGVLAAVTVAGLLRTGAGAGPLARATVGERLRPLRSPAFAGALGVTFLVMTASFGMYTYLPLLLPATGPAGIGLFVGVFGAGGLVGSWWGGAAADRREGRTGERGGPGGRGGVVAAVGLLGAGFVALPHLATTVAGALAVMAGWGVAAWAFVPAQQHRLLALVAQPGPLPLALNSSAVQLGAAAGALSGGVVVDTAGAGRLWPLAVACCGAGLAVHAFLARDTNRPGHEQAGHEQAGHEQAGHEQEGRER